MIFRLYDCKELSDVLLTIPRYRETATSLYDFLNICMVAVHHENDDLLNSTIRAASRALADCLSDQDEEKVDSALNDFLGSNWDVIINDPRYTPLMFKVLREHLYKLDSRPVFKKLRKEEPLLADCLFDAMMEDQAQRARAMG
jgi:hypothetical protein